MLVLTRRNNESLLIGPSVRVLIRERPRAGTVNLTVEAPTGTELLVESPSGQLVTRAMRSAAGAGRTLTTLNIAEREWLRIGSEIRVGLCPAQPSRPRQLRIGVEAPSRIRILREELAGRQSRLAA